MADVSLKNIQKIYDSGVQAVFDFNLEIKNKEFIVFVGPSGCGKSTTLRMIAGLEDISAGDLLIDGQRANDKAPKDREIAMVFQSYALYPHMSIYENMAFGLSLRKVPVDEIEKRVKHAADILGLTNYLDRKPKALSGGQRQRVALGRAIVRNAKVFLMDEPLSNLDAKLRVHMRSEIIKIHEQVGTTTIYVTHDQVEAMTMATRIVVMKDGRIQQIGTPKEVYNEPNNVFVAGFMGSPAMNFLKGTYKAGKFNLANSSVKITLPKGKIKNLSKYEGKEIIFGIRPEHLYSNGILTDIYPDAKLDTKISAVEMLGHELIIHGTTTDQKLIIKVAAGVDIRAGNTITFDVDMNRIRLFDAETELVIE